MVIAFGNRYIGKMQAIQAKSQAIAEFALTIKPLCKNRRFRLIQIRFEFLALTMLDENDNGWILNAMHSREGCYTYIKEIVRGESYIELSEEEKQCLEKTIYQEEYDIKDMEK